jgi:hypothetical protein
MVQYRAAWLIGSYADLPSLPVTISGSFQNTPAGNFYLYDADNGLSLRAVMNNIMAAAGLNAIQVYPQKDGHMYIAADAVFTVTWGSGTLLRDLLGFTGDLAGAMSYTAPNLSPLLWMPGKPETPLMQRLGLVAHKVHTVYQVTAPYSGRTEAVSHGSREYARYLFPLIDTDRVVTAGNEGGTWAKWFEQVAVRAARWKLYREVLEDSSSTASALVTLTQPLGPYIVSGERDKGPAWVFDTSKGFERVDARADIDIRCHVVEEYP